MDELQIDYHCWWIRIKHKVCEVHLKGKSVHMKGVHKDGTQVALCGPQDLPCGCVPWHFAVTEW